MKHAKGQRAARPHGEKRKLGQLMRQGCLSPEGFRWRMMPSIVSVLLGFKVRRLDDYKA
ncbi:MAG TPA: hypothetical protein VE844_09505 [Gammaproteobacteria bacterium]|nr:hypothetical protein [Gammaproteobacteria bacterium]